MIICKVDGCDKVVGPHGAHGMCPYHNQLARATVRVCPVCGETKKFYNNAKICKACEWWEKNHNGEKRNSPRRIRDGVKAAHLAEYNIYRGMKERCRNPKRHNHASYGGRGIKICERWLGPWGFHHFYEDMGPRPTAKHSLDRIDVNGDYEPSNCRWADMWTQANNKRDRRLYSRRVGVTYNKSIGMWVATICAHGKVHSKYAHSEAEAILLREQLERTYIV